MSKKSSSPPAKKGGGSSIVTAMYDAQKREISSSLAVSLSFIGAGLIVAVLGVLKYFRITSMATDSSDNIDAWAWLVIAGVGIIVIVIGIVSISKSLVSLSQLDSASRKADSHASPFQNQRLNRRVAAMNQSQSMQKPDMQGMAEDGGKGKTKGFIRGLGKNKKKQMSSSELYDKYNPQQAKKNATPQKAAPIMEQKFDYGLEEEKKLTFADEFLMKNKRDPFAQYRKELGIKEEAKKPTKEQKPQFIPSATFQKPAPTPIVNNNTSSTTSVNIEKKPETPQQVDGGLHLDTPQTASNSSNDFDSAFDLSLLGNTSSETKHSEEPLSDNFVQNTAEPEEQITATEEQNFFENYTPENDSTEEDSDSSFPYGDHREEDDGIFFSARSQNTSVTQGAQQTAKRPASSSEGLSFKTDTPFTNQSKEQNSQSATPRKGDYNFSLFEEIDPVKSKEYRTANTNAKDVLPPKKTSEPVQEIVSNQSRQPVASSVTAPVTENSIKNTNDSLSYNLGGNTESSAEYNLNNFLGENNVSEPVAPTENSQYNLDTFAEQNTEQTTTQSKSETKSQEKKEEKQSFSAKFLNRNKSKPADSNNKNSQEICVNGTPSQRKFVDASEYDEWTCPKCGKTNQEYVGLCACGTRKPRSK